MKKENMKPTLPLCKNMLEVAVLNPWRVDAMLCYFTDFHRIKNFVSLSFGGRRKLEDGVSDL